jgi:mitochondrial fission protein ELM1
MHSESLQVTRESPKNSSELPGLEKNPRIGCFQQVGSAACKLVRRAKVVKVIRWNQKIPWMGLPLGKVRTQIAQKSLFI